MVRYFDMDFSYII